MYNNESIKLAALFSIVILLPGCEWFCGSDEKADIPVTSETVMSPSEAVKPSEEKTGESLLTINGRVAITADDFDKYLEQIGEQNPQFKAILAMMPEAKVNVFEGMMSEELINEWIRENGIDKSDAYQKDLELATKMIRGQIAQKHFQEAMKKDMNVSDKEAREYYESHKTSIPELLVTPETEIDGNKMPAVYRSFDEVKDGIKQLLESEKSTQSNAVEIEKLKSRYDVVENKEFFERNKQDNGNALEALQRQMEQMGQEEGNDMPAAQAPSPVQAA